MIRVLLSFVLILSCLESVAQQTTPEIAKRLAGLQGTYAGTRPCSDCNGIECSLTLQCDSFCHGGRFLLIDKFIDPEDGNRTKKMKGNWAFVDKKTALDKGIVAIVVHIRETDQDRFYQVEKNGDLTPVDPDLKKYNAPTDLTMKKR